MAADPGNYLGVVFQKMATLLFQFPAVFWCVIAGLVYICFEVGWKSRIFCDFVKF